MKIRDNEVFFDRERVGLEGVLNKMKDDLEMNQVNFMREKDRSNFLASDFDKEVTHLRAENASLMNVVS